MIPINEWRHIPVYVGGPPVLLFPDPTKVPAAMEAFFHFAAVRTHRPSSRAWANEEGRGQVVLQHHSNRPYTASAWLHHALVSVHPFRDGNGRTTRLVASIPLMLNQLPPINIASEDRLNYRNALAAVRPSSPPLPFLNNDR